MNIPEFLLIPILLPAAFAVLTLLVPKGVRYVREALLTTGLLGNLIASILVYGREVVFQKDWLGFGIDFSLRLYSFSGFILLCAAALSFAVSVYTVSFFKDRSRTKLFYSCMLFTVALANGAVLADNLVVMLFFWEGILATMFGLIMAGGDKSSKTAVKALVIGGLSDLALMLGIGVAAFLAGTLSMEEIRLPLSGLGLLAFLLMLIGAISKAGSMPFHTWIPDAANDAPMPFLSFLPGTLEKLLGIYLLVRITGDLFEFTHGSSMSILLMTVGAGTILFAVMMALIQKDFKRLLSYHAISQVGYMMLGIGTALPVGIIGGVFHMINHAIYKCCLFFTAGSVERQTGTTDLKKISGLGRKMPVTFAAFLVAAASIAGFPLTNGFFSKELIFDGALETNIVFYLAAVIGAFFTAVSFLKLGHAAFFGKTNPESERVKEAPLPMLIPMLTLAAACLVFGFGNSWIVGSVIKPALGEAFLESEAAGPNWVLIAISAVTLTLAALDHWIGFRKTGSGLKAADHFHDAPVLRTVYSWAEKKWFDPYYVIGILGLGFSKASLWLNDGISKFYDVTVPKLTDGVSLAIRKAHTGNQALYVAWVLGGAVLVAVLFFMLSV